VAQSISAFIGFFRMLLHSCWSDSFTPVFLHGCFWFDGNTGENCYCLLFVGMDSIDHLALSQSKKQQD